MTNSLTNNTIVNQVNYPAISDELIECLKNSFPNQLPETNIGEFELGVLVGIQKVINKLITEKDYNENEYKEDED